MAFKKIIAAAAAIALFTGTTASAQVASRAPAPVKQTEELGGAFTIWPFLAFAIFAVGLILVVEDQEEEAPVSP